MISLKNNFSIDNHPGFKDLIEMLETKREFFCFSVCGVKGLCGTDAPGTACGTYKQWYI